MRVGSWVKLVNCTATYWVRISILTAEGIHGDYCFRKADKTISPLLDLGFFGWGDIKSIKLLKRGPKLPK